MIVYIVATTAGVFIAAITARRVLARARWNERTLRQQWQQPQYEFAELVEVRRAGWALGNAGAPPAAPPRSATPHPDDFLPLPEAGVDAGLDLIYRQMTAGRT